MTYQPPAQGILKTNDWGDSKSYRVACDCGSDDHVHDFWVEADDSSVTLTVYVNVKTKFWSVSRWRQMWKLLTQGHLDYESALILNRQQAFNYAQTIHQAIEDVEDFRISSKNKS